MELKNIVIDLKYATQLKKLGVNQTSSYAVYYGCNNRWLNSFDSANHDMCGCLTYREKSNSQELFVSAFTTDELFNILPKEIKHSLSDFSSYYLYVKYDRYPNISTVLYKDYNLDELLVSKSDKKLSNALARVLIYLLKHNLLKEIKKEKKQKALPIPTERTIYKKMPQRFYSFKLQTWILITKPRMDRNWYIRDLINEATGEKIDDILDVSLPRLSERVLRNINNVNMF